VKLYLEHLHIDLLFEKVDRFLLVLFLHRVDRGFVWEKRERKLEREE